jgi:hypothetical protein
MVRLCDGLAHRRLLYPRPLLTVPSLLVIDIAEGNRSDSLVLGRFYPIVIENEDELAEVEAFLSQERPEAVPPDLLDWRPSRLVSDQVLVCRYDPPLGGWPWAMLCRWPTGFQKAAIGEHVSMARGCYTMDLFHDPESLETGIIALLGQLERQHGARVKLLAADTLPTRGLA